MAYDPGLTDTLILKEKKRNIGLFGKEPSEIVIPYHNEQIVALLMFDKNWQIAIGNYFGQNFCIIYLHMFC